MLDEQTFKTLLEGTGKLQYTCNCTVCGKEFQNQNYKSTLRARFLRQGWTTFMMCRSCRIKVGRSKRTPEDEARSYEKRKQTNLKKYGYENPFHDTEKIKQATLKKYGYENPSQVPVVKEKKKQTSMKHWGVKNPGQSPIIQEKMKQTNLKKRGVEYSFQDPALHEKARETCRKEYGVDYYAQTDVFKNHLKDIWKDEEKKRALSQKVIKTHAEKSTEEKANIQKRIVTTNIAKYGTAHPRSARFIYEDMLFDSSWELAVWIWAHDMGKCIKREPISFEYEFKNKTYHYYPDFEIDGQLVEVKGTHFFKENGDMQNPYNHDEDERFEAKHQCGLQNDVQFWTWDTVEPIIQYIANRYGPNYISSFRKVIV